MLRSFSRYLAAFLVLAGCGGGSSGTPVTTTSTGTGGSGGSAAVPPAACGSTPVQLAAGTARNVAVDGSNVYAAVDAAIVRHPRAPSGKTSRVTNLGAAIEGLRVDFAASGGKVFWRFPNNPDLHWADGSATDDEGQVLVSDPTLRALTANSTTLFWVGQSGGSGGLFAQAVRIADLAPQEKTDIVGASRLALVADGADLFELDDFNELYSYPLPLVNSSGPFDAIGDGVYLFATNDATPSLWELRGEAQQGWGIVQAFKDGSGGHITIAPDGTQPFAFAPEGAIVYAMLSTAGADHEGSVVRIDTSAGDAMTTLADGLDFPADAAVDVSRTIAVDDHNVYFGTLSGLYCVSK